MDILKWAIKELNGLGHKEPKFIKFNKIPRLNRDCIITEKIDGTNGQIYITEDMRIYAGSRKRWLTPGKRTDNFGFARWVEDNKKELLKLGPGRHYGEWFGQGIQRKYGLKEKRFYLFNVKKWEGNPGRPSCCGVVPILYEGKFSDLVINKALADLDRFGSRAVSGFMDAEGVVVYHKAAKQCFKVTIKGDEVPKNGK